MLEHSVCLGEYVCNKIDQCNEIKLHIYVLYFKYEKL